MRLDNLVIKGLPDVYAAVVTNDSDSSTAPSTSSRVNRDTTLAAVINLCQNHLKVNVTANDISMAHRLPKGRQDTSQPVLIRFTNRQERPAVADKPAQHLRKVCTVYVSRL